MSIRLTSESHARNLAFSVHILRRGSASDNLDNSNGAHLARILVAWTLFMSVTDLGLSAFTHDGDRDNTVGARIAFGLTFPVFIWSILAVIVTHYRLSKVRPFIRALGPIASGLLFGSFAAVIKNRWRTGYGFAVRLNTIAIVFNFIVAIAILGLTIIGFINFRLKVSFNQSGGDEHSYSPLRASSMESADVERNLVSDRITGYTDNDNASTRMAGASAPDNRESFDVRGSMDSIQGEGASLLPTYQSLEAVIIGGEKNHNHGVDVALYQ